MKDLSLLNFYFFLFIFSFSVTSCEKDSKEESIIPAYSEDAPLGYTIIESEVQKFWLDTIASKLDKPWSMVFLSNGDILYCERSGSLHRIDKSSGEVESISGLPDIHASGQGGLLDLILDPEFESNSYLYFSYSKNTGNGYSTAVSRAKLSGNSLQDVEELFVANPPASTGHHFGSRLVIRENYLYISVGDRGTSSNAQDPDKQLGKIIRIDLDVNNAEPEIWSSGHRNPQGLALHPETGDIWEHEHGPKGGDELNVIRKGKNYGWPEITYGINYDGTIISNYTHKEGMEQPITYWVPSIAPCGMTFISGNKYPNWKGNIFLGGLAARSLFRVVVQDEVYVSEERLLDGIGRVRNVAFSPDGFLYVAIEDPGIIFRVVPINN